ncbi:MAG: hypothetical protein BWY89_00037 [Bacteroidetes bacterium ADurb.BinA012]|nr:MAG: hypothetical protein BWY89_00037 [Bacteroidetes bacterium ADurb.BinA012]
MRSCLPITALIFSLALLAGCKTVRHVPVKDSTDAKVRVVREVNTVQLPPDSAWLKAYFECDSNNRALLQTVETLQGERVKQHVSYSGGLLMVRASDTAVKEMESNMRDSVIFERIEVPYPVEVPIEVNRLTQWQGFQLWIGRLALLTIAIWLLGITLKNKLKTKF